MNTPPNSRRNSKINEQSWCEEEYSQPIQDSADLCIGQNVVTESHQERCQNEEENLKFIVDQIIKDVILNIKEMAPQHQELNDGGLYPNHFSELELYEIRKSQKLNYKEISLIKQDYLTNTLTMESENIFNNDQEIQPDFDDAKKNDQAKLQDFLENGTISDNSQEILTQQSFSQCSCPSQNSTDIGSEHVTTPKVVSPPSTQISEPRSNSSTSKNLEKDQMQQDIEVGLKATRRKKHQNKRKSPRKPSNQKRKINHQDDNGSLFGNTYPHYQMHYQFLNTGSDGYSVFQSYQECAQDKNAQKFQKLNERTKNQKVKETKKRNIKQCGKRKKLSQEEETTLRVNDEAIENDDLPKKEVKVEQTYRRLDYSIKCVSGAIQKKFEKSFFKHLIASGKFGTRKREGKTLLTPIEKVQKICRDNKVRKLEKLKDLIVEYLQCYYEIQNPSHEDLYWSFLFCFKKIYGKNYISKKTGIKKAIPLHVQKLRKLLSQAFKLFDKANNKLYNSPTIAQGELFFNSTLIQHIWNKTFAFRSQEKVLQSHEFYKNYQRSFESLTQILDGKLKMPQWWLDEFGQNLIPANYT
eukprot:403370156